MWSEFTTARIWRGVRKCQYLLLLLYFAGATCCCAKSSATLVPTNLTTRQSLRSLRVGILFRELGSKWHGSYLVPPKSNQNGSKCPLTASQNARVSSNRSGLGFRHATSNVVDPDWPVPTIVTLPPPGNTRKSGSAITPPSLPRQAGSRPFRSAAWR
jgi:hypothetical protein